MSTASTRSASHPRITPTVSGASLPPVMTASAAPARMVCMARPIAWALDAHADTAMYDGPRAFSFCDTAAAGALYIDSGIDIGGTRAFSP